MQELWKPSLKAWFPEGLADPDICLIKVEVESAEIWDAPPAAVVKLYGMAKAAMTGQPFAVTPEHRFLGLKS